MDYKVFIQTNDEQYLGALIGAYALRRNSRHADKFSVEIMHARDMRTAILVSDPFHMLRLRILSSQYGVDAYTSPTQTSPISSNRAQAFAYVLSESIKVPTLIVAHTFSLDQ